MMNSVKFITHTPPPDVAHGVLELWLLEDGGSMVAGLPKPYVELVISLSGIHWWRSLPASREHRFVGGWVTPIQAGPRFARSVGPRKLMGARLHPWAAHALFGVLPDGNGTPPKPFSEFAGLELKRLRRRLCQAKTDTERFAILGQWLSDQQALHSNLLTISDMSEIAKTGELASRISASTRTLRRRFGGFGVSPKRWLTLRRLDSLLRDKALKDKDQSLAKIALDHGFADQAHLAREVQNLTGTTPTGLRRRAAEFPPHYLPVNDRFVQD